MKLDAKPHSHPRFSTTAKAAQCATLADTAYELLTQAFSAGYGNDLIPPHSMQAIEKAVEILKPHCGSK